MILIEIHHVPVPWAAHGGYGKKSFNPRSEERAKYQWQIKAQFNQINPIEGPISVDYTYHIPIPKAVSKARRLQMLNGMMYPITRPDVDNYDKMLSDCFNGIVWKDDAQVVEKRSRKIYGELGKIVIKIEAING